MARRAVVVGVVALVASLTVSARRANAQAAILDDLIIISKAAEESGGEKHILGRPPGLLSETYGHIPGSPSVGPAPRELPSVIPTSASMAGAREMAYEANEMPGEAQLRIGAPMLDVPDTELPQYGPVDIPRTYDAGPANGLTLDMAINRLIAASLDLKAKSYAIPEAQANVLSAGLRSNPYLFFSAGEIPYGEYNHEKPGDNTYGLALLYPLDVTHKRKARERVATRAKSVIEAQYQDAVRQEIGRLYHAYVNVLAEREAKRFAEAGVEAVREDLRALREKPVPDSAKVRALENELRMAQLEIRQTEGQLHRAKVDLAALLSYPLCDAGQIQLRGSIFVPGPPLPAVEDLVYIALRCRPDLAAHRLGMNLATAEWNLAKANSVADLFLLYEPYHFTNHAWTNERSSTAWALGIFSPIPVFNRNQGHIRKAEVNIAETQTKLAAYERIVASEVIKAADKYAETRETLYRIDREILPHLRKTLNECRRRLRSGQGGSLEAYQAAQSKYNSIVRRFRDVAIKHRRNTLHLNTVVGQRIML